MDTPDVEFDLGFDPGESQEEAEPVQTSGSESPGEQPEAGVEAPPQGERSDAETEPAPQPPAASTGLTPEQQLLYERAKLEGERAALIEERNRAAQGAQPVSATAAPETSQERQWNIQVPDEMIDALGHEDPRVRKGAVAALANGVAQLAYKYAMEDAKKYTEQHFQTNLNSYVQQHTEQARIYQDFYGAYPELDKPELRTVVRAVGEQLAREFEAKGVRVTYSPEFRDLLGTRTMQVLGIKRTPAAPTNGAPPTPLRRNPLPKTVVGKTRPAPAAPSVEDEIADLLGI